MLGVIPGIGGHLDIIIDQISVALSASIGTILVMRVVNRIKG